MKRADLNPQGFFRRVPLAPHETRDRFTRTEDAIVLCHLGVPRIERNEWSLAIDGLVARPLTFRFADLLRYPKVELTSIHQCAGSPLQPLEPTRRICNVKWAGVRLADILADCGPMTNARYVWSYGADYGEFGGVDVDAYVKDLPIARVQSDVLVAYEMNGEALKPEHGFPARLVVPGFYGTNSIKWLTRISLAEDRATGAFTTRWYNDPVLDSLGRPNGQTVPVWAIAPESIIVSPAPGETVAMAAEMEIHGWSWADGGVRAVDVTANEGLTWSTATVEPVAGRQWQRFSLRWKPGDRGSISLASRAESNGGARQPVSGWRNAIHRVPITIR